MKVSKEAEIRNQYNQVPHLTQDTTWESDKNDRKHHIQERQEASSFPVGDHKAEMNNQESMINTNMNYKKNPQKKHRLGTVNKNISTSFMVQTSPLLLMWIKTNIWLVRMKDSLLIDVSSPSKTNQDIERR